MKTTITQSLNELRDFVITQAAEDAALPSSELRYQEKLVADVLGQEAPNGHVSKNFSPFIGLKKPPKVARLFLGFDRFLWLCNSPSCN